MHLVETHLDKILVSARDMKAKAVVEHTIFIVIIEREPHQLTEFNTTCILDVQDT
jgi:hypothetical protein